MCQGFALGDLREPSVFTVWDTIKLIDSDWAGKEGEARYSSTIYLDREEIDWHHPGVRRGGLVKKAHDEHFFKKPNSDGTPQADDGSSHTDPRLGLLGLTDPATAVQQFHQVRVLSTSAINAPSPLSPGFSPSPSSTRNAAEDKTIHLWQDANDISELVPLDSPLMAVELGKNLSTFRATTQEVLVQGWSESGPASPLVKLPASALRRPTLPCSSPYPPSPPSLVTHSPMVTTSLADGAGAATESSSWEDVELGSDEEKNGLLREDLNELPPRPASPAPMFFFCGRGEEFSFGSGSDPSPFAVGHGGLEAGMVSVSVQPVSC
ncbi:hypothetical protein GY45DRAFT_1439215 [Cubamyces sp. BRFM 1775]|nr:hypothetical protein GY45DRAFT_1439215 [Cubamyces sp. BRFM 1775]